MPKPSPALLIGWGAAATIVMSPDVPHHKIEATIGWGADVVMAEPTSQARRDLAERLARDRGLTLIPPYDDVDVITGQATVGLELLEQTTDVPLVVIVPIGGGGLIAGIALAIKLLAPQVEVIGVGSNWRATPGSPSTAAYASG